MWPPPLSSGSFPSSKGQGGASLVCSRLVRCCPLKSWRPTPCGTENPRNRRLNLSINVERHHPLIRGMLLGIKSTLGAFDERVKEGAYLLFRRLHLSLKWLGTCTSPSHTCCHTYPCVFPLLNLCLLSSPLFI